MVDTSILEKYLHGKIEKIKKSASFPTFGETIAISHYEEVLAIIAYLQGEEVNPHIKKQLKDILGDNFTKEGEDE